MNVCVSGAAHWAQGCINPHCLIHKVLSRTWNIEGWHTEARHYISRCEIMAEARHRSLNNGFGCPLFTSAFLVPLKMLTPALSVSQLPSLFPHGHISISKAGLKRTQVSVSGRERSEIMQYMLIVRHAPYLTVKLVNYYQCCTSILNYCNNLRPLIQTHQNFCLQSDKKPTVPKQHRD